jgi:hypothetical protein
VKRSIVSVGVEPYNEHREDFRSCPHCDFKAETEVWENAATTLVLEPRCYKKACVAIISECPKCFQPSWVHEPMDCFNDYTNRWPKKWVESVNKREAVVRLKALRDWAFSLCGKCAHLESGEVNCGTYRRCKRGCGPVEMDECELFQRVKL